VVAGRWSLVAYQRYGYCRLPAALPGGRQPGRTCPGTVAASHGAGHGFVTRANATTTSYTTSAQRHDVDAGFPHDRGGHPTNSAWLSDLAD